MNASMAFPPSAATVPLPPANARPVTGYSVIASEPCHEAKEQILGLMRSNFSWRDEADVWYRWAYEQSPYSPNLCWFVETANCQRVGHPPACDEASET